MCRVFISYRRTGTAATASLLHFALQKDPLFLQDDEIFLDTASIPRGQRFRDHIWNAIERTEAFVVLIDNEWLNKKSQDGLRLIDQESDFCRIELQRALERVRAAEAIEVLPVIDCNLPQPRREDIPESISDIVELRSLRWDHDDYKSCLDKIIVWVSESLGLSRVDVVPFRKPVRLAPKPVASGEKPVQEVAVVEPLPPNPPTVELDDLGAAKVADGLLLAIRKADRNAILESQRALQAWTKDHGVDATEFIKCKVLTLLAEAEFYFTAENHEDGKPFDTRSIRELIEDAVRQQNDLVDIDTTDRLLCLQARVNFIDGRQVEALATLADSISPLPFKFRLIMLQELDRLDEANALLDAMEPCKRWTDVAITIRFALGHEDKARELLSWTIASGDEIAAHHCRIAIARCYYWSSLRRLKGSCRISPAKLTRDEVEGLQQVFEPLEAVIRRAIDRGHAENGLELQGLELALQAAHMRSDRETATPLARVLSLARPASIQAGHAFLWGYLPYSAELAANLRADRPTSFEANYLALAFDFESGKQAENLISSIKSLWPLAADDDDKERLAGLLLHIVPELPGALRPTVIAELEDNVGTDDDVVRLLKARQSFAARNLATAKQECAARTTEDPEWDILLADIAESENNDAAAFEHLQKAGETINHPDLLWRAAVAASRLGNWPTTVDLLVKALNLAPDRVKARRQLFMACMRVGSESSLRLAIVQLQVLAKAEPTVFEHILNQAIVHEHLKEFDQAISILDRLLERTRHEPTGDERIRLSAILLKARILSANKPAEAFSLLNSDSARSEFGEQIPFWQGFMQLAYRTGQDAAAHEAMKQILRLENDLSDDQKSLWAADFEELKEILLARGKFLRELRRLVTSSRCTMNFLAKEENRPLVHEFLQRTKPMIVPETEEHHGMFVTYSSNTLVVSAGKNGFHESQELASPSRGSNVVIDPTSIVTLHRLGLLDTALSWFSHVRVPGQLLSGFINDVEKLQPHQRSSRDSVLEVERLLVSGLITRASGRLSVFVVEFDGETNHSGIGVRTVIDWLHQNGQIGEDEYVALEPLSFDDTGTVEELDSIIATGSVGATTRALTTLAKYQLLDRLLVMTAIQVTEETHQEIAQTARSYRQFEGMRADYESMIDQLRNIEHVDFDGFNPLPPETDSRENQIKRYLDEASSCVRLAKEHGEHLLVDDRVCQQMFANERQSSELATFSSWHLIEAMYDADLITMAQCSDACLQLMKWRYRFFIPRANVLLYFASQFRASCPGQPLRDVAAYMMDCFADPGLHCGIEPTSPPFTISSRLYHRWMVVVVDFVVGIWASRSYSLDQRKQFVAWALTQLAPVPATHAQPSEQTGLAHVGRQLILSSVLVRLPAKRSADSPTVVLLTLLRDLLGISKLEYFRTLGTTFSNLQSILHDAPGGAESAVPEFLQRMAELAVGADDGSGSHELNVDHFELGLLMSVGYLDGKSPNTPSEFTSDQLAAISSSQHVFHKADHGKGPLCFLWKSEEKKAVESVDVTVGLAHSLLSVRLAICNYFHALGPEAGILISEFSNKLFQELEPAIRSNDAAEWYPAAISLIHTFERDFLFNVAGFAQSLPLPQNLQHLRNKFATRILNPPDHPAKYVAHENFDVLATAEVWQGRIESCVVAGDSRQTLHNYVVRFRHLTLDGPFSMAGLLGRTFSAPDVVPHLLELAQSQHPLDQFQGCKAICEFWPALNAEQRSVAVPQIGMFLSLMFEEPNTVEGYLWYCRKLLVRHYVYQSELYEPGWPADAIAALAWKLADLVMEVIAPHAQTKEDPVKYIQQICEDVIRPMTERREFIAKLIRPPLHQTTYRLASLDSTFGSPFGFGLICEIGPVLPQLLENDAVGPIISKAITKLILANGTFTPVPQGVLFRSAVDQWHRLIDAWLENDPVPDRSALSECVSQYRTFTDPQKLAEAIQFLPSVDNETRVTILYQINRLAVLDHLPPAPLWNALSDETFQKSMLQSFDVDDLKLVINAIITIQQSQSPDWSWQLPYVLLGMLKSQVAPPHADVITAGLFGACCRAEIFSALRHINGRDVSHVVIRCLRQYVVLVERKSANLPSFAACRIRQILEGMK